MHEFSICQNIVAAAESEYARLPPPPPRLRSLRVVAGGLHQIVPEYLIQAYAILTRETPLEGSVLELRVLPVRGTCRQCHWEGDIQPPLFQCARCEQFDVEMTQGRELYLEALEVEAP